jgi:hypothetical protein
MKVAVSAPRGKNFKPVLLACALASKDEHGFFYAKNVTHPLRLITCKNYDIPAFARHLKAFSSTLRGPSFQGIGNGGQQDARLFGLTLHLHTQPTGLAG